jgi:hypothetical protein
MVPGYFMIVKLESILMFSVMVPDYFMIVKLESILMFKCYGTRLFCDC